MADLSDIYLKWHTHHDNLVTLMHSLLENKKLVDVTLAAEGKYINVHNLVLCAASSYLEVHFQIKHSFAHYNALFKFYRTFLASSKNLLQSSSKISSFVTSSY